MGHVKYNFHPPYYDSLASYEWVDDFLRCQEIKDEIKFIRSKCSEVKKVQSAKEDMLKRYKASWQAYEDQRIAYLAKYLAKGNGSANDPFSRLMIRTTRNLQLQKVCIKLDWEDVEKAIDVLFAGKNEEALSDAEREKRLEDIDKAIEQLTAQLKKHSPQGYFKIRNGQIVEDFRQVFVSNWRNLQGRCKGPVNPKGGQLSTSPDAEKEAYRQLGIAKAINPRGLNPNPNYN